MKKPKRVGLLGAGNRGKRVYSDYILKNQENLQLVGIAEPNDERRQSVAKKHGLNSGDVFSSWEEFFDSDLDLDGIIIATMDQDHIAPALFALEKGLPILLEKPMATSIGDLEKLSEANEKFRGNILVAHVLRYTLFFQKIKELLDEKEIGDPVFIQHTEKIGYYHFAHSFVRGNWRKEDTSCPIILAKCCHDFDLLNWWLPEKCIRLTSRGNLSFFHQGEKPPEAKDRCFDCPLEEGCIYSARKIYPLNSKDWPASSITDNPTPQAIERALKEGPYGRCVFSCDNDVPDSQIVEMEFENNLLVQLALTGFSSEITRTTNIFGTRGEISGDFGNGRIEIKKFGKGKKEIILGPDMGDHGGGDFGLMEAFTRLLHDENLGISTGVEDSLESHFLALAAEKSRKEKCEVKMTSIRQQ